MRDKLNFNNQEIIFRSRIPEKCGLIREKEHGYVIGKSNAIKMTELLDEMTETAVVYGV